jgi:protein-S-isoprenylcysteine O-methyltransferase Ste14
MERPGRKPLALVQLDWPPVWTLGGVALAWAGGQVLPWPILGEPGRGFGVSLVLVGLGLMAAAVWEMRRAKTTVIPRRIPQALVTTGIFTLSRNPVYLGDVLVVAGAMLWYQAVWMLPLVVVFAFILEIRFIRGEEDVLAARFGEDFAVWRRRTGRWFGRI